jgi:hypothetical protein
MDENATVGKHATEEPGLEAGDERLPARRGVVRRRWPWIAGAAVVIGLGLAWASPWSDGDDNPDPTPALTDSGQPSADPDDTISDDEIDPSAETGSEAEEETEASDPPPEAEADPAGPLGGPLKPEAAKFCQAWNDYANTGGPYSAMEVGSDIPPFSQADRDHWSAIQAVAPEAIKSATNDIVSYAPELQAGNWDHLFDYEDRLNQVTGYMMRSCGVDVEIA